MKWPRVWSEGRRKAVYGSAAFAALVTYAFHAAAPFESFASHLEIWLGAMLVAHVAQERLMKTKAGDPPAEPPR